MMVAIMRILIVEDDNSIAKFLRACFEAEYFAVDVAEDGASGLEAALSTEYDLILLDYALPKIDGKNVCKKIRAQGRDVPIIMMTVMSEIENVVEVLNLGADDYLAKPFEFAELLARTKAVLRRPRALREEVLKFDDLVLDCNDYKLMMGSNEVYLTRKEFALLRYFMSNLGKVLSRQEIFEHIWDAESDPFSNTIESHILNLRKKINLDRSKKLIITVPGRGYRFA